MSGSEGCTLVKGSRGRVLSQTDSCIVLDRKCEGDWERGSKSYSVVVSSAMTKLFSPVCGPLKKQVGHLTRR